ncbi:Radical SAM domain protein [Tepidanaerobacter acetatoxydans Re1]|uniref:Radical SAM domain protein n=2 Tax=Tepidanaerobacter acetatoxydans TaxID=499229 RepID=F4LW05_TEPAE|nr:TIGR03960 family B12-binding radical SAM protein [Tepidanaerobacter acetatoxydans]AEE91673.1 Radical SAM domain protein [Tepidanaerobacter acetatoxydans Re1]CCP26419.1 Radical SAM domain protein [Tepidanaerobacter acetatoxydans Re1]
MTIEKLLEKLLPQVSKPTRYMGNEYNSIKKDKDNIKVHVALAFPDVYEVGMSHLGIKILYHLLNQYPDIYAERVFAPWVDFEGLMRKEGILLFSLESKTAVAEFDFLGFTLQYEMSYTNILNMLELSGIPIFSNERREGHPFVIAGGPCTYNPEPLSDIVDFFVIGEAEEVIVEIMDLYKSFKERGESRQRFLEEVARISGVYVPSLYHVSYNDDGTMKSILPKQADIPRRIQKRLIKDLDNVYYPTNFVVPYMDIVHDRAVLEIFRGCTRGCRFCQAGMIYRPVREKSVVRLEKLAKDIIASTGYGELSLASLSTSDYSKLKQLTEILTDEFRQSRVSLSLPSLRIDAFSLELAKKVQEIKKSGLTFAPEAGTQRLRDVINKGVTAQDLLTSVKDAFSSGWKTVKLYFMIGLPTETYEDIEGIANLAFAVVDVYKKVYGNTRGLKVNVSTSTFVPKPFTPFQWESQITLSEIEERQRLLRSMLRKNKNISYSWHDGKLSFLEAVFSRGDRRLGQVLKIAHDKGCKFDGWNDMFSFEKWMSAFNESGICPEFYAYRKRSKDELCPWDIIDPGIDKKFLLRELEKSQKAEITPDCRIRCHACGVSKLKAGGFCETKNEI